MTDPARSSGRPAVQAVAPLVVSIVACLIAFGSATGVAAPAVAAARAERSVAVAGADGVPPARRDQGPNATGPAPQGCDPSTGTWCDATGIPCSENAGAGGTTACAERRSSEWTFAEGALCRDCGYTFYVLLECGRELHLPLDDMERMKVRVTDLLSGRARPLRCVNGTARAEAAGSPRPTVLAMECDGLPGVEEWWGPAFDETDNDGAGVVAWGFPQCADLTGAYDANGDGVITCGELPPGGGVLDALSPGEGQVMDCFVADASAACGLYRVDVASGGLDWRLLANCDGSPTPGLEIFFDCAEAWAAYDPLPELVLEDLVVSGACPDVVVTATVRNVGCAPTPGDVALAVSTDCSPADVVPAVARGPIAPGEAVRVDVPLSTSCNPATVTVTVDPADALRECGETATTAACRAQGGQDSLSGPACGCVTTTQADAGPDREVCSRGSFTLTGSVTLNGCAASEHRWLDAVTGAPLGPWGASLESPPIDPDCSGGREYVFETRCAGTAGDCPDSDGVAVTCLPLPACFPSGDGSCRSFESRAGLSCGCRSVNMLFMDKDTSVDADGNGDPADDRDIEFACNVTMTYPRPGYYTVRVWYDFGGCITWAETLVDVQVLPLVPVPIATPGCPGDSITLDCGVSQPGTDYTWDLDVTVDADGDLDPANDVDATGCVVTAALPPGAHAARVAAVEEGEPTCVSRADLRFDVPPGSTGLEVRDLRLSHAGPVLRLSWAPLAIADSYRLVRGDIGTWYGHRADDPAGIGACTTLAVTHVDPDDAAWDGASRYYLVGAVGCGVTLGPLGDAWDGSSLIPRPAPVPTASCP